MVSATSRSASLQRTGSWRGNEGEGEGNAHLPPHSIPFHGFAHKEARWLRPSDATSEHGGRHIQFAMPALRFITATLALLASINLTAAETNSTLTLSNALRLAEEHHPRLAEKLAAWNAAEQRAIQAGLRPNPKLIVGTEEIPLGGGSPGRADYLAGVSQEIRLNNTATLTKDIAAAKREQAALEFNAAGNDVRRSVQGAFATALFAQASEQLFAERVAMLETSLALIRAQVTAGELIPEAGEIAHADLDHERLDHNEALELRGKAFARLATAIGKPDLPLPGVAGDLGAGLGFDDMKMASLALDQLPELLAAGSAEKVLRLQSELARASRIPSLDFELLYRRKQGTRENAMDVRAAISLPLFDDKRAAAQAFAADADAARARTESLRQETRLTFNQLRTDLRLALRRAGHIRDEILPHRETIVRRHKLLFEAGETSRLDYEKARLQLTEEKRHHLDTLRETHLLWAQLAGYRLGNNQASR